MDSTNPSAIRLTAAPKIQQTVYSEQQDYGSYSEIEYGTAMLVVIFIFSVIIKLAEAVLIALAMFVDIAVELCGGRREAEFENHKIQSEVKSKEVIKDSSAGNVKMKRKAVNKKESDQGVNDNEEIIFSNPEKKEKLGFSTFLFLFYTAAFGYYLEFGHLKLGLIMEQFYAELVTPEISLALQVGTAVFLGFALFIEARIAGLLIMGSIGAISYYLHHGKAQVELLLSTSNPSAGMAIHTGILLVLAATCLMSIGYKIHMNLLGVKPLRKQRKDLRDQLNDLESFIMAANNRLAVFEETINTHPILKTPRVADRLPVIRRILRALEYRCYEVRNMSTSFRKSDISRAMDYLIQPLELTVNSMEMLTEGEALPDLEYERTIPLLQEYFKEVAQELKWKRSTIKAAGQFCRAEAI